MALLASFFVPDYYCLDWEVDEIGNCWTYRLGENSLKVADVWVDCCSHLPIHSKEEAPIQWKIVSNNSG